MLKLDMKSTVHLTVIILLIFFASPESQRPSSPRKPARLLTAAGREATPARRRAVMKRWGDLPLRFQENVGQYPGPASKFVARGKDWTVLLNHTGIILDCASPSAQLSRPGQEHKGEPFSEIRLRLTGAHGSARMSGEDKAPVKTNYFVGNDSQKWFTGVPSYGKVRYTEAFPGIDLVFYGTQGRQVECDFEVASHADPTAIRLRVEGTGDDTKVTVSFPGYGLKKLIAKYAGIKVE